MNWHPYLRNECFSAYTLYIIQYMHLSNDRMAFQQYIRCTIVQCTCTVHVPEQWLNGIFTMHKQYMYCIWVMTGWHFYITYTGIWAMSGWQFYSANTCTWAMTRWHFCNLYSCTWAKNGWHFYSAYMYNYTCTEARNKRHFYIVFSVLVPEQWLDGISTVHTHYTLYCTWMDGNPTVHIHYTCT